MKLPIIVFLSTTLLLAGIFFTLPINLFDGVIEYVEPTRSYSVEAPLSLSYFIGLGYDDSDMTYVSDFYLTTKGTIMAIIFMFGFPALLAFRLYLKSK